MKLQLVDQSTHRISVYCLGCRKMRGTGYGDDSRIYADLDGPAFKAYFCVDCVRSSDARARGMASYAEVAR